MKRDHTQEIFVAEVQGLFNSGNGKTPGPQLTPDFRATVSAGMYGGDNLADVILTQELGPSRQLDLRSKLFLPVTGSRDVTAITYGQRQGVEHRKPSVTVTSVRNRRLQATGYFLTELSSVKHFTQTIRQIKSLTPEAVVDASNLRTRAVTVIGWTALEQFCGQLAPKCTHTPFDATSSLAVALRRAHDVLR